ncbi:hypothetical protein [Thalassolituus oleivorans]|uniref:hypothetical protein n=1 Tax=Thalassolituus oleivorans TaxID=187493 RepID=UPI0023F00C41|nr:hypothetical protein [Thalassolituus oleivorans]
MQLLACDSVIYSGSGASGSPSCSAWVEVTQEQMFLETLEQYFGFDPELFAVLIVGMLLTFVTGHVTGVIVKTMNRT